MEKKYIYSKIEIATFLKDFINTIELSSYYENNTFFDNLKSLLMNEGRYRHTFDISYYQNMRKVFSYMLAMKHFSIFYDMKNTNLKEDELSSIDLRHIFVNSNEYNRFSKKQIIKCIRNAFNHNDMNEILKFINIDNNIKVEITLNNTKPIPFHVIIDLNDILSLMSLIINNKTVNIISMRNSGTLTLNGDMFNEFDKVYFRKFFNRKSIDEETFENVSELTLSKEMYDDKLEEENLEYKDYRLNRPQKVKIIEDLEMFERIGFNPNLVFPSVSRKVMPISALKIRTMVMFTCLTEYMSNVNSKYSDFKKDVYNVFNRRINENKILELYTYLFGKDINMYLEAFDTNNLLSIPSSIFYSYIFDSLIKDEEIIFNENKKLPRNKIRDSFVHLRWFLGAKNSFKLYDWVNNIDSEFDESKNGFWKGTVSKEEMRRCALKYYNREHENAYPNFDEDISILKDANGNVLAIKMTKNSKLYIYLLNKEKESSYYKLYICNDITNENDEIEREATNEEREIFINELLNQTFNDEYIDLINNVIEKLRSNHNLALKSN